MTPQEVFNRMVTHALTHRYTWAYRTHDGQRSASGALIDDADYIADMEGLSWLQMVRENLVPLANSGLISDVQRILDTFKNPTVALKRYASSHSLEFPSCTP